MSGFDLILENVTYYDGSSLLRNKKIYIKDGVIQRIENQELENSLNLSAAHRKDCTGMYLYPSFCDAHLHMPGKYLFSLFGMDLVFQSSIEDYFRTIDIYQKKHEIENASENRKSEEIHKGFGWNEAVLEKENGFERLLSYLEKTFPEEKAILFSDDFHHAICNRTMKEFLNENYPDISIAENNQIEQESLFALLATVQEIQFTDSQMEKAILLFQQELLQDGISAIQMLFFIGGNGEKEYRLLKRMDEENKIRLQIRTACTVYPFESMEQIQQKYEKMKQWDSEHIKLRDLKLYMDGVVDNKTAFLLENYEQDTTRGRCYWGEDALKQVCAWADSEGIQIHIHAVGDGAVHAAVSALKYAMDQNQTVEQNHPVITHLQLADDADIEIMGKYGMIAALQPYWINTGKAYYPVDARNLGKRVYQEYKIKTFFEKGVLVTGSSDSPVVQKPLAFCAMKQALMRENKEEIPSIQQLIHMFTQNAAVQMGLDKFHGRIAVGYKAECLLLNCSITEENICNDKVMIVDRIGGMF